MEGSHLIHTVSHINLNLCLCRAGPDTGNATQGPRCPAKRGDVRSLHMF